MRRTTEVLDGLRRVGYRVSDTYLRWLLRERWLPQPGKFGESYAWTDADVERLRSLLLRRGRGPVQRTRS